MLHSRENYLFKNLGFFFLLSKLEYILYFPLQLNFDTQLLLASEKWVIFAPVKCNPQTLAYMIPHALSPSASLMQQALNLFPNRIMLGLWIAPLYIFLIRDSS